MNYIKEALKTIDFDINSNSKYINSNGLRVPRVTEIISRTIHNDSLMYWANHLGFKGLKYKQVLNEAASFGTLAHESIELFLKEKIETDSNIPFLGFLQWYNTITKELGIPIEILQVEMSLCCDWFGGTLDALLNIDGKVYLVDFKTSNHVTFNYFLQLAAYRYMLKVIKGIDIDGVIVLQLGKQECGFNEYLLDFSIPEHFSFIINCETTFLSLVYAYYNLNRVESEFKNIF